MIGTRTHHGTLRHPYILTLLQKVGCRTLQVYLHLVNAAIGKNTGCR